MDWITKIRELAEARKMSLRQLAADLGVSQQFLNDVVNSKRAPSLKLKLAVLSRIGYDAPRDALLELLLTDEQKEAVLEWEHERGVKRAEKLAQKAEKNGSPKI